ncbi:MAG: protein-glutamate O-methyltransferase CheR [Gammaproteobacteria bacterium]|nr:protein-glutamate O-methyltransferase CheR [Gammaproteobacteria bacterium]
MSITKAEARPLASSTKTREFDFTHADFKQVQQRIYKYAGISLADHKVDLVYNRLVRRIRSLGINSFTQYFEILDTQKQEFNNFVNAMTTNLTSFYREAHHFEYISETYLPALAKEGQDKLRIWSSACSVGEEPYSIGISLLESGLNLSNWDVEILATDIDTEVLATAKAAIYALDRIEGLSTARKKLGFLRGTGDNRDQALIKPQIRKWMRFSYCNLMEDWPIDAQLDIIFCRNVMIYFDKKTQNILFDRMEKQLKPGGLLCIGHSESPARDMKNFKLLGRTMYQKIK